MNDADEPPIVGQGKLETARTIGTFVFALTGVALVGWPVAAFVAIFIFDAPIRDAADEAFRYSMAGAIWGYPVFWGVGLALHRNALKRRQLGAPLYWPIVLPLLPLLWLTIVFAFGG